MRWIRVLGRRRYASRQAKFLYAAVLLAGMWPQGPVLAGPGGELDAAFGEGGLVNVVAGNGAKAIVQQPGDGKLVVAGSFPADNTWPDFAVLRLNPDGSFDEGFGLNGVVTIDFDGRGDEATALALQPDGKIVVAGMTYAHTMTPSYKFGLARLNPDGSFDTTFGSAGRVVIDVARRGGYLADIDLADDGSLTLTGTGWNVDDGILFARLDARGVLDETFGTGPIPGATVIATGLPGSSAELIRQPDGKYVACGTRYNGWDPPSNMVAVRINPDGSPDTGFGTDGLWYLPSDGGLGNSGVEACVRLTDGTFVIAGHVERGGVKAALVRLRPDGLLDTASWSSGIATFDAGANMAISAIVDLGDGRLAVAGTIYWGALNGPAELGGYTYPVSDVFIAQIEIDTGLPDPDFGDKGVTIVDMSRGDLPAWTHNVDLIRQSDGKLASVAGVTYHDALDTQWGQDDYERLTAIVLARVDPRGSGSAGLIGFADGYANVGEGAGSVTVEVKRTGGSVGHVLVDYETVGVTASAPGDFTATSGTLTWLAGDTEPMFITVPINDDTAAEGEEWFRIELSSVSAPLANGSATVWIVDDDTEPQSYPETPHVTLPGVSGGSGGGGASGIETLLLIASAVYVRNRRRARDSARYRRNPECRIELRNSYCRAKIPSRRLRLPAPQPERLATEIP